MITELKKRPGPNNCCRAIGKNEIKQAAMGKKNGTHGRDKKCTQLLRQETCREGTYRRLRHGLNNNNKQNICVKEIGSLVRFCEPSTIIKAAKVLDKLGDYQPL
jgi:hypothetical protein